MDRILYTASNGAARILEQQSIIANNMANVATTGFRAQLAQYRSVPVVPEAGELPTRVSTVAATPGSDMSQGAMVDTGHALDAAIAGPGWFAVQTPQGEAYTRAGEFAVNQQNQLVTQGGWPVLSAGGQPIEVPDRGSLTFASDGQISALGAGDNPRDVQLLAQFKLVNPPAAQMQRGDDGLFRMANGQPPAQPDPAVKIAPGFVEKSNVNPAQTMVAMIANARQFELQMQVVKNASSNEDRGNSILSVQN
ncbi:MAG TPA: flagellar basal-body rod protein FlgF [Castellaniella sp.]|uniref:flagellar basal-body rod protein FlgF n=1 Tax=Castellaniella sp. TaxID=1955812 RepID=UPI002EFEC940